MTADPTALEQQFGLPPGILLATRHVESGGNPNAVSNKGAIGAMQFTPATAKAYGIDPRNPDQSMQGAARLWADNLKASGGDVDKAAMMYHGGPDTRQWGPLTKAYPGKLLAALQGGATAPQASSDPFEAAFAGKAAPAAAAPPVASRDPFEVAFAGGKVAPDVAPAVPSPSVGPGHLRVAAGPAGSPAPGQGGNANPAAAVPQLGTFAGGIGGTGGTQAIRPNAGGANLGIQGGAPGSGGGLGARPVPANAGNPVRGGAPQASDPYAAFAAVAGAQGRQLADALVNFPQGLQNVKQGGLELIGRGTDAIGLTHGLADSVAGQRKTGAAATARHTIDPNGIGAQSGQIAGEIAGTAPLSAIKVAGYLPKTANAAWEALKEGGGVALTKGQRFARYLASSADAAAQGASGSAIVSQPGSNVGTNAGVGAGIGAAIGAVSPVLGRLAGAGIDLATSKGKQLAHALGIGGEDAAVVARPGPSTADLAAAVRGVAGGDRRTILANAHLSPEQIAHVGQLVGKGVPIDQAIREVDIRGIGAAPAVPHVTRNFGDQQALNESAKLATPEGQALMARQTGNNAAAHSAVTDLVSGYGGVPARGEASAGAAKSLADAADASRKGVTAKYAAADAASMNGAATVKPDALNEFLADKVNAPVTKAGAAFMAGMRTKIKQLGAGNGATATQLEKLRQTANDFYSVMNEGNVNPLIGRAKAAIDDAFGKLGADAPDTAVADAYKAARATHAAHMDQFDVPGVADLIKRDAKGNFVNDPHKAGNRILANTDPRAFANVVDRLKKIGDTASIDRLKASALQDAYEAVTNSAHDAGARSVFNGRRFAQQLDKLGQVKLDALFTPAEQGKIATLARGAMHVNEAVPGAVNNSSTGSTLLNALRESNAKAGASTGKIGLKDLLHQVPAMAMGAATGHEALMMGASLGAATVGKVAGMRTASKAAQAQARTLMQIADPEAARTAATARQIALAKAVRNQALGGTAARLAAPVAATQGHR